MKTVRIVARTGLPADALVRYPSFCDPDLWLELHTPRRNVTCDLASMAQQLAANFSPLCISLAEVATLVYTADLAVLRWAHEAWTRTFEFLIPVSDSELWRECEPRLSHLLGLLSGDNYLFQFCEHTGRPPAPTARASATHVTGDCVALLSGGIDSMAGAVMLLGGERQPLFFSHRPANPTVAAAQEHVVAQLRRAFGAHRVPHVRFSAGPSLVGQPEYWFPPPEQRESSQRARAFLYLSLGAVAAHTMGAPDLFMPENGVLAINLPLTAARIGGYSTLSTHPLVLDGFRRLAGALGISLNPDNPLIGQTKGQLVRDVLKPLFSAEAIQKTVSCWMAGRSERPCGSCIPCLIRAVAMRVAGLPLEAHLIDPLCLDAGGPQTMARANLVDLLTFADRLLRLSDQEMVRAYPALLDVLPVGLSVGNTLAMLRRFAVEVRQVVGLGPDTDSPDRT